MTVTLLTRLCSVCRVPLSVESIQTYLGDPMHLICGPGSRNQMTLVRTTFCGTCGLLYRNGGGLPPESVPTP